MAAVVIALLWGLGLLALYAVGQRWLSRRRSRERVFDTTTSAPVLAPSDGWEQAGFLTRWLFLAGYRAEGAALLFLAVNVVALCLGLLTVYLMFQSGMVDEAVKFFAQIPGGVGELFGTLVRACPWVFCALLTLLPCMAVWDARKRRIAQVEQDLPVFLELLATLSEAGLGFDAALARLLDGQSQERVLTLEFRTFQSDVLSGRPRVQCLRRLTRRLDVISLTIFVSALIQAEQVGSGVADVLRRQSDDLRDRRRERAMAVAATLPVKMLFPLVICFLPAILAFSLGPLFYQVFKSIDPIIRNPAGAGRTR